MAKYNWTFKFSIILSLGLLGFNSSLKSQNEEYTNPLAIVFQELESSSDGYLNAYLKLQNINSDSLSGYALNSYYQAKFTLSAFMGDFENVQYYDEKRRAEFYNKASREVVSDSLFDKEKYYTDAKTYIIEQAKNHQIIIINEAHHLPYHRVFLSQILAPLNKLGYSRMACETLSRKSNIKQRGYPLMADGSYSMEPLYADMLRKAAALGYEILGYEATIDCEQRAGDKYYCDRMRDSMMAVNIAKSIHTSPSAKTIIYCGHSHVKEGGSPRKVRLAEYFKRMTGIDPLTIDQTQMIPYSDTSLNHRYYNYAQHLHSFDKPSIFFKNGKPWSYTDQIDITLFSPQVSFENGRATFYKHDETKVIYELDKTIKTAFWVQAFFADEKEGRIPVDQTFIRTGKEALYLEEGNYDIVYWNEKGEMLKAEFVEVRR